MIEQTLYAPLVFALCAVAWQRITEPGEVFAWLPSLLFKRQYLSDTANRFKYAVARVTWACSKCIAGFWCLWFTVFELIAHSNFDWFKLPAPLLAVAGAFIIERYLQD
jgi:hypothetical protein